MHTDYSNTPTRNTPPDRRHRLVADHSVNLRAMLEVDVVGLLVRRYGITPATARAHADAFGFGGSR